MTFSYERGTPVTPSHCPCVWVGVSNSDLFQCLETPDLAHNAASPPPLSLSRSRSLSPSLSSALSRSLSLPPSLPSSRFVARLSWCRVWNPIVATHTLHAELPEIPLASRHCSSPTTPTPGACVGIGWPASGRRDWLDSGGHDCSRGFSTEGDGETPTLRFAFLPASPPADRERESARERARETEG